MCVVRVLSYFYVERERERDERERERDVRTFSKKKSAKKEEQEDKAIIKMCVREGDIDKERETQYNHGNQR